VKPDDMTLSEFAIFLKLLLTL